MKIIRLFIYQALRSKNPIILDKDRDYFVIIGVSSSIFLNIFMILIIVKYWTGYELPVLKTPKLSIPLIFLLIIMFSTYYVKRKKDKIISEFSNVKFAQGRWLFIINLSYVLLLVLSGFFKNYFLLNLAYLVLNLSILPAVSTNLAFPV